MSDRSIERGSSRKPALHPIVYSIAGAALMAAIAAAYDYAVTYFSGNLTPAIQGFLIFIVLAMLIWGVVTSLGYAIQSIAAVSIIFVSLSVYLLSWFIYALFFTETPEMAMRHMSWVVTILIIPSLVLKRVHSRRFGAILCSLTAAIAVAYIVHNGTDPFTDRVSANLIIFLLSLGASWLLLDGFAMHRESAIKHRARSLALQETATIMRDAAETAEAGRNEAEKSVKLRETFLATMSHELRTPLNAIIGFSEVIKSDALGQNALEKYRAYASDIHQSGEHVLCLINQLLDYSRIQSGTFDIEISPVCLEEVAGQVHRMMASTASKKGVLLVADWDEMAKSWVSADHHGLLQIALNLVGNAVKFTEPGGTVTLKIEHAGGVHSAMTVTDTGTGIAQDKLSDVCQPFVRLGDATLASETGTGLGLAIVTTLAAAMGAQFSLESELGKGTVARVRLPSVGSHEAVAG